MKKVMKITCILLALIVVSVSVYAVCFFTGYKVYRDVRYCDAENGVMDIYIPRKAYDREYNGCVLFIHGGSWTGGDKKEEFLRCRNVANKGYIAATMNYTLQGEHNADSYHVGIVLDEITMALQKLQAFALEKGIVINKAATSGYSAGAHLSMLYSYSRQDSSPIEIVFTANMAGPAEISFDVWGKDTAIAIGERLTGKNITDEMIASGEAEELLRNISPTSYVTDKTPPSIFIYGGKDTTVNKANGEALKAKFEGAGVDCTYIFASKSNHLLFRNIGKRLSYNKTIVKYCEKYFNS